FWPPRRESFIVTRYLSPCVSLEDLCWIWKEKRPGAKLKKRIIIKVAEMVRAMHDAGVNHRDCYICHFLLKLPYDPHGDDLKISIIDLHRSQIRREVPTRWRDKDLVALYFSSLDMGLTRKDYFLFLKHYFRMPLREILSSESKFFVKLEQKTRKIKNHTQKWNL
uniref:lipopolysaccharide core heptose(I) kinase RfaP n=1 Tax=Parasutterella excrementihominis TaxID=487175 RepID=UPI003AF0CB28